MAPVGTEGWSTAACGIVQFKVSETKCPSAQKRGAGKDVTAAAYISKFPRRLGKKVNKVIGKTYGPRRGRGTKIFEKTKTSYRGPAPPIIFGITLFTFFPSRRHDRHGNFVREESE